jgi:STE24 endopeptidase
LVLNAYAVVILTALLLDFLLGVLSDCLNIRRATERIPEEFADVYSAEAYAKSQRYLRAHTRFGLAVSSLGLATTLAFWFLGGFAWLDRIVRAAVSYPIARGILFIGSLILLKMCLSIPFSAYSTFVIEEKFGFNRTTWKTFVMDRVKGLALTALLGIPLLAAILYLFGHAGDRAWLYCWTVTVVFTLIVQFVAPVWLFPLFNRFTPLPEGELRSAIVDLCDRLHFPVTNVFAIDGSRRSSRANAFVTGFGRHKRIALYDTLIDQHRVDELVAIVAHELGHWRRNHVWKGLALGFVHSGVVFYLLSVFLTHEGLFEAFGVAPSIYAGLVFFGLLYAPVEMLLSIGVNAMSRRHEYQADSFAAKATEQPAAMARALKKLSVNNLENLTPHPLTVVLDYSHPPVLQRVRALSDS